MDIFQCKRARNGKIGKFELTKINAEDFSYLNIKKIFLPTRGHLATETIMIGCDLAALYDAEITVVHIVKVPYLMPLNTQLLQRETYSHEVLERAKGIGEERQVRMELKMIRSRSVTRSILEMMSNNEYDLLIMGSRKNSEQLGKITEKIVDKTTCRTWICR